ncbi:MAG: hypothetical protein CMI96_05180 [Pelagibacteraceae bacterium]|nr:hypothetical protein [Pelagibacteraceae bacterium]PPR10050.1 MAG: 3-mercaptopropionate dioxygenase [Alphaproteobacteria bacterium MarineAlpha11_Bin1]|tara:strand:+ start:837 stop:1367 length:531 start_codon:yes stop_codon:yes gene_type:complete
MEMKTFCRTVSDLVAENPIGDVPALISSYLPEILKDRELLTQEQKLLPPTGYGRHDVFLCPNDDFSIIAAVWPAGIVSPIHDHKTWCTFGVFEGVIQETRYEVDPMNPGSLDVISTETREWVAGDVAHLPVGDGDIHCMHNPTDRTAVSVHVYGGNSEKLGPNVIKIYQEADIAIA